MISLSSCSIYSLTDVVCVSVSELSKKLSSKISTVSGSGFEYFGADGTDFPTEKISSSLTILIFLPFS